MIFPQFVEKVIFNWKIAQIKSRLKGNPRREFPLKNSPPDCFSYPFLRFMRQKSSAFCGKRPKALPLKSANLPKGLTETFTFV